MVAKRYTRLQTRHSPRSVVQGVHHLVISIGTSLLDALKKCHVLLVDVDICVSGERGRLVGSNLPIREGSMDLRTTPLRLEQWMTERDLPQCPQAQA